MDRIEEIRKLATDVRQIMETLKKDGQLEAYGYPYNIYPNGCCGVMSVILTYILREQGFGLADYICGEYYSEVQDRKLTHAWLNLDGICIDLTADQFKDENYASVIVVAEENYLPMKKFIPDGKAYKNTSFNGKESFIHQLIENELKKLKVLN